MLTEFFKDQKKDPNKLNVLHGSIEIANQMHAISKGLSTHNVNSKSINYYPYYLDYTSDYTLNLLNQRSTPALNSKLRKLAVELMNQYDVFHFHFGTTLTFNYSDLPILKAVKKPMVMHHWGSDVRMHSLALRTNPYALVKDRNEERIIEKLKSLSSSIKHCIIPDYELFPYVKDYYEQVHVVPSMIDLTQYPSDANPSKNKLPLLVHAPTSPSIKGTKYILEAVENLKADYKFEFKLVQGLSHQEAKEIYKKADLIIDQLHIGSYGLFSVEAMALGKPVICWITDDMKSHYPKDLPILSANPDTIKATLETILKNLDMLPAIGKNSRIYSEKYHDAVVNSKIIKDIYTN
ncbi:glycosyltransferase family 1 protein [Jeotgalibacillus sp. S-D1]|nr:glycosyltransferase family 1 protein [Jeotgalibacillus sp. S-D1]